MPEQALAGLKVIELGDLVSAPYCCKLMADLGAEVVKIEKPGMGDVARSMEPFAGDIPGTERSGLFLYLNTNKLSVTLDLQTNKGKAIFKDLIKDADFLVENNPPRLMEELGFTYEILEKINPDLIMTSITPFGQTGPHKDYKAYELNSYHSGGFGFTTTAVREEPVPTPVKAGGRQALFGAGLSGAVASLCALFARDNIGSGQHVDISVQECLAGQYESAIEHWTFNENEMGGVSDPIIMPITPLPCKDGYVFLMCVEDHEYDKFVKVMGNPEWTDNELFKDRFKRAEYWDALAIFLPEWSMQYTKEEIFRMCQDGGVPVAPAYTTEEIVNSEHQAVRGYFVDIDHPEIGRATYPGAPYKFSHTKLRVQQRAPLLGEHNEDILCNRLDYTKQDLVKMAQTGII